MNNRATVIDIAYAPKIRKNYNANQDNSELLYLWNNESNLAVTIAERDWGVDLLNQFDRQRQRILIAESLSSDSSSVIQLIGDFEAFVPALEKLFVDENSIYFNY